MAIGRTEDRVNPWDPVALEVALSVWVPIRGYHLGQQSTRLHQQAGHMTASDQIDKPLQQKPCKSGAVHTWIPGQARDDERGGCKGRALIWSMSGVF
jgi:hypothetical protein